MYRYVLIVIIFLFNTLSSFSQALRLEIAVNSTSDQFNVYPLAEFGIVVLYQAPQKGTNTRNNKWIISRFDTTFLEIWTQEVVLNDLTYSNFYSDANFLYFLFSKQSEFTILKVDINNAALDITKGRLKYSNFTIDDFKVVGENAFFGGSALPSSNAIFFRSFLTYIFFPLAFIPNFIPGKQAMLIHTNLENKTSREIAFNYKGTSSVTSIDIDTLNKKFNVIIHNKINPKSNNYIQDFKYNGMRNKNLVINPFTPKYQLLNGKLAINNKGEKIIIGTYAQKNNAGSQGVYVSKITDDKQNFIQYHSFTKMKNFFEYLDPQSKENVKSKIEKKQSNGKELVLDYNFLIHNITQCDSTYIFVAEAYQAQYHSEFRTIWVYGRPIDQIYDVFDGWKYTHAVLICIDENGKLLWDECFPIDHVPSFFLDQKTKISAFSNEVIIASSSKNIINFKIISQDTLLQNRSNISKIDLNGENINAIQANNIVFWYNQTLISYGVKLASKQNESYVPKNSKIYYLEKFGL